MSFNMLQSIYKTSLSAEKIPLLPHQGAVWTLLCLVQEERMLGACILELRLIRVQSRDKDGCTPNVRVLPWYLLCLTLGFLGIITNKYLLYRAYIGVSHRSTLVGVHPTIP